MRWGRAKGRRAKIARALAWRTRGGLTAVRFLTVLPLPGGERALGGRSAGASTAFFPVVGLALGVLLALVSALPLAALPRAALIVAVWVGATGGLHEDGWMDSLDAAFAPGDRARRREILKDPQVGAHGATGGGILLLLRFAGVAAVPGWGLVAAPIVGRWAMVVSLRAARPLRAAGLGAAFRSGARPLVASGAAALCLAGLTLGDGVLGGDGAGGLRVAAAWAGGALAALAWGAFLHRRFGGLSGDGHGAVGAAAELGALYMALLVGGGVA